MIIWKTKKTLTRYLEYLFLKELEDEDRNTGNGNTDLTGGDQGKPAEGSSGEIEGEETDPHTS